MVVICALCLCVTIIRIHNSKLWCVYVYVCIHVCVSVFMCIIIIMLEQCGERSCHVDNQPPLPNHFDNVHYEKLRSVQRQEL